VTLSTFDGAIEVRPWDQPQVLVEIEKRALDKDLMDDIEVLTEQNGSRVSVEVRTKPGSSHWGSHRSARLIVSLPATSDVMAKSGDGAIDVEGVSGRIDLRSGDGAIRGHELTGDVTARTGDGSIRLDRIDGRLDMNTGDGSVTIDFPERFDAELDAHTGDGHVSLSGRVLSNMTESTRRGIKGRLGEGGHAFRVRSGDGSIRLGRS
jgi:hypothetical protein